MSGNQESNIGQQPAQTANQGSGTKKRNELTQERVRELFDYDELTGDLIRIAKKKGSKGVGSIAGCLGKRGYCYVAIDGKSYRTHRIIWLWHYGYTPENNLDHINRVKTDNRIENLREVNQSENLRNTVIRSDNKTGVKGVRWDKRDKSWVSTIKYNKEHNHLYQGRDIVEAVAHRLAAEQILEWIDCNETSTAYQYMQTYLQELKCQKS